MIRLIEGLLVVIILAIATGKYGELREFALKAGNKALHEVPSTPSFFNKN